ncbi:MAG: hypothetical protein ACLTA0_06820 [Streptococcus agalactiae]
MKLDISEAIDLLEDVTSELCLELGMSMGKSWQADALLSEYRSPHSFQRINAFFSPKLKVTHNESP